jgi:hypothetical protein
MKRICPCGCERELTRRSDEDDYHFNKRMLFDKHCIHKWLSKRAKLSIKSPKQTISGKRVFVGRGGSVIDRKVIHPLLDKVFKMSVSV